MTIQFDSRTYIFTIGLLVTTQILESYFQGVSDYLSLNPASRALLMSKCPTVSELGNDWQTQDHPWQLATLNCNIQSMYTQKSTLRCENHDILIGQSIINNMFSPRSKEGSETGSFTNFQRRPGEDGTSTRRIGSDMVDERIKSHRQLETFYMPYLKKVFEDNRSTNPSLRSPEQLIFNSRLLELKDSETRRKVEFLQKQNQSKDKAISHLNQKLVMAIEKLRVYDPTASLGDNVPQNSFEEADRKVKKLEGLLRIKNEETYFRLKLKAMNLMEQFNLSKEDTQGMNQLDSESTLFEFVINKLKTKIREFKIKLKSVQEENEKEKLESERLDDELRHYCQTNEILKSNEKRLKDRLEDIKKEWSVSNEKLIVREKDVENMDIELFRLKRLLQERESLLLRSNSTSFTKTAIADDLKKEFEQQVRDQRTLLTSYSIEINQLKQQLQNKESELDEVKIRDKFNVQEKERVSREYIRWKERYEWYEKEEKAKVNVYQERNKALEGELEKMKNEIVQIQSVDVMNTSQNADLKINHEGLIMELQIRNEQVRQLSDRCNRLEHQKRVRETHAHQTSRAIVEDITRKKHEEMERRLQEKDYYYNNMIQEMNHNWQQRYLIKDQKHRGQVANLQNQLKKIQEFPLIKKKSDYIQSRTTIEASKTIYDRI